MKFSAKIIPQDSILHQWLKTIRITEVPDSYAIATILGAIGCCLKRNIWCDQIKWQVYPNLSVLLVGPSGIGKDVAINEAGKLIHTLNPTLEIGGKTMETIVDQLARLGCPGTPSCALIRAPEITAFLGGKDYQKSMVQELTDLLSTGDMVNISTKSEGRKVIHMPTITMLAGSTVDWLHKAMPDGSLEGGLFPRFLIICEEYNDKHVPLIKYSTDRMDRLEAAKAKEEFYEFIVKLIEKYQTGREIVPDVDAIAYYENWYINRFKSFSPTVRPYANRSRDQVLRLAMLSAVCRGKSYMDVDDMRFADHMIAYVASTIDHAAIPPSTDAKVARAILDILPATPSQIYLHLSKKFDRRAINNGLDLLNQSEQITREGKLLIRREEIEVE